MRLAEYSDPLAGLAGSRKGPEKAGQGASRGAGAPPHIVVAALGVFYTLLISSAAWAGAPALRDLEPHGAQRGRAITLTLKGTDLAEGAVIHSTLPASFAPLAPKEGGMAGSALPFLVEIRPEAPVGLYPIRVETREGLSNVLLFSVGLLPEVDEEEPQAQDYSNDSPAKAQPVVVPGIINGSLRGPDQDFYRFEVRAGQRLVFEVEARRAGSAVDPVVRVFDARHQPLASNDDAPGLGVDSRVQVAFPADGVYYVAVHDSKFSAQAQNFYRLKIGAYRYADGIFPLGWKRGAKVEVEFFGGSLAEPVKALPAPSADAKASFTTVSLAGDTAALPFPFAVSDFDEVLEGQTDQLRPGLVINGRIEKPGEQDRYRLAVEPGEPWMVELDRSSLGTSRLYGVLSIWDAAGKKLASAGDTSADPDLSFLVSAGEGNVDTYLAFQAPAGTSEITIGVEDLLGRGGPGYGYRLLARRQPPDFNLTLATPQVNIPLEGTASVVVTADRRGLVRPIRLSIPEAPDDLIVEGGHIPGEGSGQTRVRTSRAGVLTLRAKPGASPRVLNLSVWGEVELENGERIRRRAQGPGLITAVRGQNQRAATAPWMNLELPARIVGPRPAALEVTSPRYVKLVQGGEAEVEWKFLRRGMGIRPPAAVNAGNLPGVGNLRVLGEKTRGSSDTGKLTLVTTVGTPPMKFDMVLETRTTLEGREETIVAPAVTFDIVQGFTLEPPRPLTLAPGGGRAEIEGRLNWEPSFAAPATVKADALPHDVSCQPAEVKPQTPDFRLSCQAGAAATPGEYDIELAVYSTLAGRDKENVPYTIPPVGMKLLVSKIEAAQ